MNQPVFLFFLNDATRWVLKIYSPGPLPKNQKSDVWSLKYWFYEVHWTNNFQPPPHIFMMKKKNWFQKLAVNNEVVSNSWAETVVPKTVRGKYIASIKFKKNKKKQTCQVWIFLFARVIYLEDWFILHYFTQIGQHVSTWMKVETNSKKDFHGKARWGNRFSFGIINLIHR